MRKVFTTFAACLLAAAMCLGIVACGNDGEGATLSSIAMKSNPTKTEYVVGETFDPAGATITVTYSDETTKDVSVTAQMCSAPDMTTVGEKDVTVTYTEGSVSKTTTFQISVAMKTADGADVIAEVESAEADDVIELEANTQYIFRDVLDLDKKVTVRGGEGTVLDFSQGNENGKAFRVEGNSSETNPANVGLVNIYADGVTLENVKIVGDLQKAVAEGEVNMNYDADNQESNANRAAFGIFISRNEMKANAQGKPTSQSVNVKETITLKNVEITQTAMAGIYAYCIYADSTLEGDALYVENLDIHDIGNLAVLKASAAGIMFQSGRQLRLKNVNIDAGENGPALYVHMSTAHGPIDFEGEISLSGTYNDAEDKYGFSYALDNEGAGRFASMQLPLMIHCNIDNAGSTAAAKTTGYLPDDNNGDYAFTTGTYAAMSAADPYQLTIEGYFDSKTTPVTPANYAARPARWGSPVFCIDLSAVQA